MTNKQALDALLPCPLCNGTDVQYNKPCPEGYGEVHCNECGLDLSNNICGWEDDKHIAIKRWNARTALTQPNQALVEALVNTVDVADRIIERGYGADAPQEWHDEVLNIQRIRATSETTVPVVEVDLDAVLQEVYSALGGHYLDTREAHRIGQTFRYLTARYNLTPKEAARLQLARQKGGV